MANCCAAEIALMRDGGNDFSDEEELAIQDALIELDHCGNGAIAYRGENIIEWQGDTHWTIPEEELREIAKQFNVHIRAVGREAGLGFVQVVCIRENGRIIQSEALDYAF